MRPEPRSSPRNSASSSSARARRAFTVRKLVAASSLVGLPQARCQNAYEITADFGILARVFLEILPADEAQLAIPDGEDRCRPWPPIDDGEFAGDLTGADNCQNPLVSTRRGDDDFEQSPLEPIASVASIASHKKWFTGFEVMLCRGGEQSRRQMLGQTWQYSG